VARIGTRDLEQIVYAQGLVSRRKARRVLKAVLDAWRKAIRRGEVVEIPGGEVKAMFQDDSSPQRLARLRQGNKPPKYILRPRVGRRRVIMFRPTIDFGEVPEARKAADLRRYEAWVNAEVDREMVRRYGSNLKPHLTQVITNHIPASDRAAMSRQEQFARAEQLLRDSLKEELRLKPFAEWLESEAGASS
jgi:nucleoid DNA-binding protein